MSCRLFGFIILLVVCVFCITLHTVDRLPSLYTTSNISEIWNNPVVNHHNFTYILNPTDACSRDTEVVICVTSRRNNFRERRIVAETWGSYASNKMNKAVLLFFLGNASESEPASVQKMIVEEFKNNQSIVQEDYLDAYRNLTLKSMSILKWVGKFCRNARYVIKADTDIFSNMSLLVQNLRDTYSRFKKYSDDLEYKQEPKSFDPRHFILGHLLENAKPRRENSKWIAKVEEFPANVYPTYVSGTCYSMPVDTAVYLFHIATRTRLFWLEDVFITGIAASIGKVARIDNKYQRLSPIRPIKGCSFAMVASAHAYTPDEIKKIYTELHDPKVNCK